MPSQPHTTGSIAAHLNTQLTALGGAELVGRPDLPVTHPETLDRAGQGAITFIRSSTFASRWAGSNATCALITRGIEAPKVDPATRAVILVPDADLALNMVIDLFAPPATRPVPGVHPTAIVDPAAALGAGVSVGPGCIIGAGTRVGDGTVLVANVYLARDVKIGRACTLHPGVTILDRCAMGDACTLFPGVVIGSDGFGYRPDPKGRGVVKIPHIGSVEIGSGVEIGANACIDRAKFGSTLIGDGVKIDNLVHIGHGCRIGRGCLIAALVGLSGSTTTGDGVQMGGQVGTADNVSIAAGTRLAGKSGVIGNIDTPDAYLGTPPVPVREYFQMHATLRRLTREKKLRDRTTHKGGA